MGKKGKTGRTGFRASSPGEPDPSDARLRVTTFEDVANSEDEYFMNKDRIDFDEEPRSKRLRRLQEEDDFLEPSDEEVFRDPDDSSEEDDLDRGKQGPKGASSRGNIAEVSDNEDNKPKISEGDEDPGWWGSSRGDYYNADNIETEADALEEEAEARKIQQKKLSKMSEADFILDEDQWLASTHPGTESDKFVSEIVDEVQITDKLDPEERYKLLQARYPEFDYIVEELRLLQPLLSAARKASEGKARRSLEVVKYWVLGSYIAALASYIAILTSPARDKDGTPRALDPAQLRDHEIMGTLVTCRETWLRVQNLKVQTLKSTKAVGGHPGILSPSEDTDVAADVEITAGEPVKDKAVAKAEKSARKRERERAKQAQILEKSLADLSNLLKKPNKPAKSSAPRRVAEDAPVDTDDRSDFGEEAAIDERISNEKAQRKKSLRFYTSQIVQKANRRADAGRGAGGDLDIPYRERLKDRQARLNAEAERRGQKGSKHGVDLGGEAGDSGESDVERGADEDDAYYDAMASASRKRRDEKTARVTAFAAAAKGDRVVEHETIGEDGKRRITYAIQKNKGLAPRRKKEVRNPRVKKRLQYAGKQKKLRSIRPVYGGGEGLGGYQGELSGIKTGLIKSVKL